MTKKDSDYENLAKTAEAIRQTQTRHEWIMSAFIVVMFVLLVGVSFTLGGVMVDHYRASESSYQDLIDKINDQGYKFDTMEAGLRKYHIIP